MSESSSKNALTHGFYAAVVVLPGESQQEFDDLLRAFQDEYCPEAVSEEAAVFELACLHWKKRRFEAGVQQALEKQLALGTGADTNDLLGDIARKAAKSQLDAAQRGCESLGKQVEQICKPDEPNVDSQQFEKLALSLKEFNLVFGDLVLSHRRVEEQKLDQIEQAYRPHIMEKELKIQAEVDRRIEKVLKRLVIIKEYKKQYRPKSVNEIQIEAINLPAKSSHPSNGS